MIALLWIFGCAASAQLAKKQSDTPNNAAPITNENRESDVRAIADQLKAIREEAAKRDSQNRSGKQPDYYYWLWGNDAPVWSNWILAVVAAIAGWIAYRAFEHERDAVRRTQRADLLFYETSLIPRTKPSRLTKDTELGLIFKNFGPTRASQVKLTINIEIEGFSQLIPDPRSVIDESPELPRTVVGTGDTVQASFAQLGRLYSEDAIALASKGDRTLRYVATAEYTDVFGKGHHTICKGVYYGPVSGFVVLENNDAD
jgi:hypothetical protein